MNKIKQYFIKQASRPHTALAHDFVILAAVTACVYFGWVY